VDRFCSVIMEGLMLMMMRRLKVRSMYGGPMLCFLELSPSFEEAKDYPLCFEMKCIICTLRACAECKSVVIAVVMLFE